MQQFLCCRVSRHFRFRFTRVRVFSLISSFSSGSARGLTTILETWELIIEITATVLLPPFWIESSGFNWNEVISRRILPTTQCHSRIGFNFRNLPPLASYHWNFAGCQCVCVMPIPLCLLYGAWLYPATPPPGYLNHQFETINTPVILVIFPPCFGLKLLKIK